MSSDKKIILDNIYFSIYTDGKNNTNLHVDTKPKEIQEKYDSDNVLSLEKKLELLEEVLDYFYNYWKMIELSGDKNEHTIYFNINLIMINIPFSYYGKVKSVLESLKNVISLNVKESYFKVENKLAKYFLDIFFTFYTPIKPVHII